MKQVTNNSPLQAATPFEQKVLDWILRVVQPKKPIKRPDIQPKCAIRLIQISFLYAFMFSIYAAFILWENVIHDILIFMTNPNIEDKYIPLRTYGSSPLRRFLYVIDPWVTIIASIMMTVISIIAVRVKNIPFVFRFGTFSFLGLLGIHNPLEFFAMPAVVWFSERILFAVLLSVGAFCWLLSAVWTKKWIKKYPALFPQLPVENANAD